MRIGVLGGTFDPVHLGHLEIAEEVKHSLDLSVIMLVPAGQPLLKPDYQVTPAQQRLEMLRLAVADRPYLEVSAMEIERPGPSYTIDTITELRHQYGLEYEIFFILGWDSLELIAEWREPSRLIEMCHLVAVPRPGWPQPNLEILEDRIPGLSERVMLLEKPNINISASAIRALVAQGKPISHLVPGPVADYIREHNLYSTQ